MKAYGGVDVWIHIFLTSALAGGEWSASRPGLFTPGERAPGTHWIRGWVYPRAGLDEVEKRKFSTLQRIKLQHLGRPVRNQSLYRLSYPGSSLTSDRQHFIIITEPLSSPVIRIKTLAIFSDISTTFYRSVYFDIAASGIDFHATSQMI
jgi:hypothetical protein